MSVKMSEQELEWAKLHVALSNSIWLLTACCLHLLSPAAILLYTMKFCTDCVMHMFVS